MRTSVIVVSLVLSMLLVPADPVTAQSVVDTSGLTGSWAARHHEEPGGNALPGDYTGIPLNDEGRSRADNWHGDYQSMAERQCIAYPNFFMVTGFPTNLKIWSEADSISGRTTAFKITWYFGTRTIWMDGRPHPSAVARHTPLGFSTGRMIGDVLHVRTTHLTDGWIWQSGVPSSSQATTSEYFVRNGDMLSVTSILHDPIYMDEPVIRTKTHVLDPNLRVMPATCEQGAEVPLTAGDVPHFLPGTNPYLDEMVKKFGVPLAAARGEKATLYPEFRKTIKNQPAPPATPRRPYTP